MSWLKVLADKTMVNRDVPTMVIISNYELSVNDKGEFCVKSTSKNFCPICDGPLLVIGSRRRSVTSTDSEKKIYRIRRLRCTLSCRKIHHELPDLIVPYKRHSMETLEQIDENKQADVYAENSTLVKLKEFIKRIKAQYRNALMGLREKYQDLEFLDSPKLKELVRILVNENLWIHTRSAFCQT